MKSKKGFLKFRRIIILKKKKEIRLRSLRNLMTLKKQANNQVLKVNKPSYQRLSKRNQTIPVRTTPARNRKHLKNLNRNLKGHPKKANPAYHRTRRRIKQIHCYLIRTPRKKSMHCNSRLTSQTRKLRQSMLRLSRMAAPRTLLEPHVLTIMIQLELMRM